MADSMTWIEVVDTAVKIGLSAIIGGVGGYILTKKSQRHEFDLGYFRRRQEIIEGVSGRFESLHAFFFRVCVDYSLLVDVLHSGLPASQPDRDKYHAYILEIGEGLREMHVLEGRLLVAGAKNAAQLLQQYRLQATKVSDMIELQQPTMGKKDVLTILDELFQKRDHFYGELAKAFRSM